MKRYGENREIDADRQERQLVLLSVLQRGKLKRQQAQRISRVKQAPMIQNLCVTVKRSVPGHSTQGVGAITDAGVTCS
jgi:hypothetical protein